VPPVRKQHVGDVSDVGHQHAPILRSTLPAPHVEHRPDKVWRSRGWVQIPDPTLSSRARQAQYAVPSYGL
jgi:hypothetical protein